MPLAETEAGNLISVALPPSGGWRGEPDIVIRCSWCGYLVHTHRADSCQCGRITVRNIEGLVRASSLGASHSEVYRLASPSHAD
jgi:hypothetical protein